MKKLLMIILFLPIIAGMALTALAADRDPRGGGVSSACHPSISNVTVNPENVWAPTGKKVPIEVSGDVSADPSCSITSMSFNLTGDTTINPDTGAITFVPGIITIGGDGHFSGTVMVNLSKDGKMQEGKTYYGTIFATGTSVDNQAFNIMQGFSVTVLHDRGEKVGLNK